MAGWLVKHSEASAGLPGFAVSVVEALGAPAEAEARERATAGVPVVLAFLTRGVFCAGVAAAAAQEICAGPTILFFNGWDRNSELLLKSLFVQD
jgi:hypothetical protein